MNEVTPNHILQVGTAFWASKTLLSAVEMELFTELAKRPESLPELSARHGLHPRSAHDFLDALVSLNFLERRDGTYYNTPSTDLFLDKRKPSYIGGMLEMANNRLYTHWTHLTTALRTGEQQNEARGGGENPFKALYADPDRLAERLPALRLLARPMEQIRAVGERLIPAVERAFRDVAEVALIDTKSQIGSGALPISLLPSTALALRPLAARSGSAVEALARDLRVLSVPVIGRIEAGRVILDLRCLEDEAGFIAQLDALSSHHRQPRESGGPGRLSPEPAALDSRFRGNHGHRPDVGPFGPDP